jgi:hypothetical protein
LGRIVTCPTPLYRAFKCATYTENFIDRGDLRLGLLQTYQELEDKCRADKSEGLGHYVDAEGTSEHFQSGNVTYILCLSGPDVDRSYIASKFGSIIVRVGDPCQLAKDIQVALENLGIKLFGGVRCAQVEYSKGLPKHQDLNASDRWKLAVLQKPPSFSCESEVRIVAVLNTPPGKVRCDYLHLKLPAPPQYATIEPAVGTTIVK